MFLELSRYYNSESDRCNCSMNFFFADFVVYSRLLCTTKSAKKKCATSLWIRWKKYWKERNQFLIFWMPLPNVLWLASQLLLRHRWMQEWHHSISLYHQSQCNHFHSPHHCCFRFHRCRLHHSRCHHCLTKVHFQLRLSFSQSFL